MSRWLVLSLVATLSSLVACAQERPTETVGGSPTVAPSPITAPRWERPPEADEAGAIPVDSFNEYLETADPRLAASPLRAAVEFVGIGEGQEEPAQTTSVVAEKPSVEASDEVTVTVISDGLPDDSVRAERYVLNFEREADRWRLASATVDWRCQPNRGHQEFSTELCV